MNMKSVWVIEDDDALQCLLAFLLEREGYQVTAFSNGTDAIRQARTRRPDLALLDIGLPGESGEEVCRVLCGGPGEDSIPVVVLTGRQEPFERYRMFSVGADDFLQKPVDNMELIMRVRNKLRRSVPENGHGAQRPRFLNSLDLTLDLANHVVKTPDREVLLTPSEFAVLKFLAERPGQAVGTETLLVQALGYPPKLGNPDVLRTHVRHLRQKLEPDPGDPTLLVNLPHVGYMLAGNVACGA